MRAELRGTISSLPHCCHSLDAAQDTVGLLGCECTLLALTEAFTSQHPQTLHLRAALKPLSAQPVSVLEIAPTQMQDIALGLVELQELGIVSKW